jgi:hypothetical protein
MVAGDARAREALDAGAEIVPPDLLDRLLGARFRGFELVAHARIGAHHIFKTKYLGRPTVVVQTRWVPVGPERWRIVEVELARVAEDET